MPPTLTRNFFGAIIWRNVQTCPTCARSVPKPKIRDSTCWTRGRDWNGPIPGGQPGRPIRATHLGQRLRPRHPARPGALHRAVPARHRTPRRPARRMLGIHIDVAVALQRASAGDWMTYAADVSRRQMKGSQVHPQRRPPAPTQRLTFREMTADDLDDMAALLGDSDVMRYY